MHLLFLGVMKSVIQMVQEGTILCKRNGSFLKNAGKALEICPEAWTGLVQGHSLWGWQAGRMGL